MSKKDSIVSSTILVHAEDPKEGNAVKGFVFYCPYCKTKLAFGPITGKRKRKSNRPQSAIASTHEVFCAQCGKRFMV